MMQAAYMYWNQLKAVARIKIHIFGGNQIPRILVYDWTTLIFDNAGDGGSIAR